MLANGLLFTDKNETYMNHMNPFLEFNSPSIVAFFSTVAVHAIHPPDSALSHFTIQTVPDDKEQERLERKRKMLAHTFRRKRHLNALSDFGSDSEDDDEEGANNDLDTPRRATPAPVPEGSFLSSNST